MVTPKLFEKYPNAAALARARQASLEKQIKSTGFFRQKSKALIGMAKTLVAEHGGEVPADMEQLTKLPGVGRKTANVVLGHALGVPGLPVDRHVLRVSNRIGIAEGDDPVKVEAQLSAALPKEMWTLASDVQILHGRRICRPKPLCDKCLVINDCNYYRGRARPPCMTRAAFERLVTEAIALIPKRFRREIKNVALVVEDEPSPALLEEMEIEPPDSLVRALSGHSADGTHVGLRQRAARTASRSFRNRSKRTARTKTRCEP